MAITRYLRICLVLVCCGLSAQAQDSAVFASINREIMLNGQCYNNLRVLCKTVGKRLSGSPAAAKAVEWGYKAMKEAGADSIWLQPVDVPVWERGKESLLVKAGNRAYRNMRMLSLGNMEGTEGKPLEAEVMMVNSMEEFDQLPEMDVKGKIVFFNYRFRQDFVFTFHGYGDAVKYRWASPSKAAAKGAKAVIIRSVSTGADDFPHTGSAWYNDSFARIPAIAIGNLSADTLEHDVRTGKVSAIIRSQCHLSSKTARSYNVIGELKGNRNPEKIITVGGHLDSWDVGEGAHDDGAGCVQSIEVIRTFKELKLTPAYTVRAVLFMNEENGLKGGKAYADSAVAHKEKHVLAIETDAGGFVPRGIGMEMDDTLRQKVKMFKHLFLPYGVYDFDKDEGGADISPLQKLKVPVAGLLPDSQRYFDVHHTDNDVFEQVNHRELKLGAVTLTQFIYLVSEHSIF